MVYWQKKTEVKISSAHLNSLCLRLVLSSLNPIISVTFFVDHVTVPAVTTLQYLAVWACNMPYLESLGFMWR